MTRRRRLAAAFVCALLLTRFLPIWQPVHGATAFVQSCSGSNSGGTTTTCIFGSNITAGSVIGCFVNIYDASHTLSTLADTITNTYTLVDQYTDYVSMRGLQAYTYSASGGANTVTATFGNAVDDSIVICHEVSGGDSSTPLDNAQHKMAGGEATGTDAVTTGNITTTVNGDYLFVAGAIRPSGTSLVAGTGFTTRVSITAAGGRIGRSEELIQSSAGAVAGTLTPGAAEYWVVGIMAFKPAGGAAAASRWRSLLGVGQ